VSTTEQPERSKQHDERGQHALSCRPIELESTGGVGDQVLAPHTSRAAIRSCSRTSWVASRRVSRIPNWFGCVQKAT
jgi:hypothetical protein